MSDARDTHLHLLCDVGDLALRLADSADVPAFLDGIVTLVADRLGADVCSIYLCDEGGEELVLRATRGLAPSAVGQVRLRLGEGLTGLALKELRPIREDCASRSPHFKGFTGINEEPYESFLAVPIHKGLERIGALVAQRKRPRPFGPSDVMALQATASQLAGALESARLFLEVSREAHTPHAAKSAAEAPALVKGQSASTGFAHAPAAIHDPARDRRRRSEHAFDRQYSREEFDAALADTIRQLRDLQDRLGQRLPEVASLIFDAHVMILKDPAFVGEITDGIAGGQNPPDAIADVGHKYIDLFANSPQATIREKADDVEDLVNRLLANLTGQGADGPAAGAGRVVIARDLYPSDMLKLALADVAGIVLVSGGVTSHVAILAQSLQVPLVIAEQPRLLNVPEGTPILLDADVGNVYVAPSAEVIETFAAREADRAAVAGRPRAAKSETRTRCGHRVHLRANVNLLSDLAVAREARAEGIGLYRSEFPFLIRAALPSEAEQVLIYRRLLADAPPGPVTFRTLDLGGDKLLAYYDDTREENPALGLRSIRFTLRHREVFAEQLRAILQAAGDVEPGRLRIMFPMISSLEEFRAARDLLGQCAAELADEGISHAGQPAVGIMVEVPAALALIDPLAREADFLCVGTNDLTQFLLAADRTNEKVASYFQPHHPAVLAALAQVTAAGHRHDKEVSVCGEMAQDPLYAAFLIGVGVDALSVSPGAIPRLQDAIEHLTLTQCRNHAEAVLAMTSLGDIRAEMEGVAQAAEAQ